MSKRELAEPAEQPARGHVEDEGMGEFEDAFEDEFESEEEGEVVDGETMEIDGQPVHNRIQELGEENDEEPAPTEAYMPGQKPLPEGHTLVPDQSAYHMLHRMNVTWPCLSFDFLRDHLGPQRQTFPHTAFVVTGTQADVAKNNEVMVLKASAMHRTSKDDGTFVCVQRQGCLEAFGCMSASSMPKTNSLPILTPTEPLHLLSPEHAHPRSVR